VVAIIPHTPRIEGQQLGECFFLVEKLGIDIAVIGGVDEAMHRNEHISIDDTS